MPYARFKILINESSKPQCHFAFWCSFHKCSYFFSGTIFYQRVPRSLPSLKGGASPTVHKGSNLTSTTNQRVLTRSKPGRVRRKNYWTPDSSTMSYNNGFWTAVCQIQTQVNNIDSNILIFHQLKEIIWSYQSLNQCYQQISCFPELLFEVSKLWLHVWFNILHNKKQKCSISSRFWLNFSQFSILKFHWTREVSSNENNQSVRCLFDSLVSPLWDIEFQIDLYECHPILESASKLDSW